MADATVNFRRDEYIKALLDWELVDDVVAGENLDNFLVELYPEDKSVENFNRNIAYKERASWTGVTDFTLSGLIGTAFKTAPVSIYPKLLSYMEGNIDGENVGLNQQIQSTTREVLKKGRSALFITYPDTMGAPVSVAEQEALKYVATIHRIDAKRIINWDEMKIGAETVQSLVVFTDSVVVPNGFGRKTIDARRELRLVPNTAKGGPDYVFTDTIWTKPDSGKGWRIYSGPHFPKKGNGQHWDRLPFVYVGAIDNNSKIDKAPMLNIAKKNRDHYRNSADNEESIFFCGQSQPWASGVDPQAFEQMKASGLYIGSRKMLGMPDGGTFGFATADANTMVRQAMIDKIEEMAMMGARIIKQGSVAKTAAQANNENAVQHSILSLATVNACMAYVVALNMAAEYMNATGEVTITPDQEFMTTPITSQDLLAFKDLVLVGVVPKSDQHRYLTRHDIVDPEKTFEEWVDEIETDKEADIGEGE